MEKNLIFRKVVTLVLLSQENCEMKLDQEMSLISSFQSKLA